jgi:hypothetical protein
VYFKDSRLLVLHPTKTAGSTVEQYLMQALNDSLVPPTLVRLQYLNRDGYDEHHDLKKQLLFGNYCDAEFPRFSLQHATLATARRLLGDAVFDGARKIVTVRNPYTRLVSMYFYYGFSNRMTFPAFVQAELPAYARSAPPRVVNFGASQTLYTHQDGQCVVDLVLRQESMDEGLAQLAQFLGLPIPRERGLHLRRSKAPLTFENYMDAFDEPSLAMARKLYADDFELLGYAM